MPRAREAEDLAARALDWLLRHARETETGPQWPHVPSGEETYRYLYHGSLGVIAALVEGHRHFGDDRYAEAALRGTRATIALYEGADDCTLQNGLSGFAYVMRGVGRHLGDAEAAAASKRALESIRERFDGTGWLWAGRRFFELFYGNAGTALAALACEDVDLAVTAVEPFLAYDLAEEPDPEPTLRYMHQATGKPHHIGHGTLGAAYALIATGHASGRTDLVDHGLTGVHDVIGRNEGGEDDFLVTFMTPPNDPKPPFRYGWCNGVAGDAQVFRLLAGLTGDPTWSSYVDRCWHSITTSGLPARLHPGFWDNSGRCCGTAGVLALACDRMAETGEGGDFAEVLLADMAARATVDDEGARWSHHDHTDGTDLEPQLGWAHGNAGIVPELLRYARLATGREGDYAIRVPHQPAAQASGQATSVSTGSA
ncbi:lanthionine synthetase LanC family protein [Actinorhabdospora filicis]|nr:lanthionine synthetase LanC family protein [Actinorhabdospora filicis]